MEIPIVVLLYILGVLTLIVTGILISALGFFVSVMVLDEIKKRKV